MALCWISILMLYQIALYSSISYTHQNQVLTLFYRWLVDQSSWCLPVLYMLLSELRDLADQVR